MVMTPWYDEPVPFNMAAEIGTEKVINEHSTIGLVVTTDGSISEIPREEYEEAEKRVINELRAINKPFVVLLNCMYPDSEDAVNLANKLTENYNVPVIPVNCLELEEKDIKKILGDILYEFPVKEVYVGMPPWVNSLETNHWLRGELIESLKNTIDKISHVRDLKLLEEALSDCKYAEYAKINSINLGKGVANISVKLMGDLFYKVLGENTNLEISSDRELMETLVELSKIKKEYMKVKNALDEVEATGYGIVMPDIEELTLEEPEIMKQGGRYGVRLKASAPSIHMMKADITTEVSPIVGSEKQSEDLIMYLLSEFEENPVKIWDSNIFGKSLHELVNEGLHTKLARMPQEARIRIQETIERVINEGCNGLLCIII